MNPDILEKIAARTREIERYLTEVRRDLHRYPEIRFEEKRTGAIVAQKLSSIGVEVKSGLAETGIAAVIRGAREGKCVALRADMDAICIQDMKKVEYASTAQNVMHACGHDAHVAIVLGVGMVLNELRSHLNGSVKLLFQPSEEIGLDGKSGAGEMIKDDALRNPKVDAILGVHCWPQLRAGTVGINYGPAMAAADSLTLEVDGEGAHAGTPHLGRDSILAMSQVIVALHHIIPRNTDPADTAILHVGIIHGGKSRAILADHVHAYGTLRTVNESTRKMMKKRIEHVVRGVSTAYGVKATARWTGSMPAVMNDAHLTALAENVAAQVLGKKAVKVFDRCPMTSEDFALFAREVPGCYLKLGVADSKTGKCHPLHHNEFDIDEAALPVGVKALAAAVYEYLCAS